MKLDALSRHPLAHLPTPVEELPRLSKELGVTILIKRDDQTGLALGGNKTRKLEFLLADALSGNSDTLLTTGAPQSNHCRQTAAAAARAGMRCVLVLSGEARPRDSGNLLLDGLLGAEVVWAGGESRESALRQAFETELASHHRPYLIPYGGSNPLGASAYVEAMREFLGQGVPTDRIVVASSSGGTQAGLVLGARAFGFRGLIHGVSVDPTQAVLAAQVANLANETARFLELAITVAPSEVIADDRFIGEGYGVLGAPEREAIRLFAGTEGILLDPVYTGRAAAGLLHMVRGGEMKPGERVLFWHTGGIPALWAYGSQLAVP
ncbi:MAG: D-cysteine desulfhydrase family protein [Anaerolineales bacterium]|jgi:D-cysteine desulfhydrase family pyridoxal phosphate-dependent enzyme